MKTRDEGNCEGVCSLRDLNRTTQRDKGRTQIDHRGNIKSGNQDEVSRNKRARNHVESTRQLISCFVLGHPWIMVRHIHKRREIGINKKASLAKLFLPHSFI